MQFDVYRNKNSASNQRYPYLLDVQSDILQSLQSRIVVPLAPASDAGGIAITQLMPVLEILGHKYVAVIPQLAGISSREITNPVDNASQHRAEIIAALDLLITGV